MLRFAAPAALFGPASWLAREHAVVRQWPVPREPAVRRLRDIEGSDGVADVSCSVRLSSEAPCLQPAAPPEREASPLQFEAVFRQYAPYVAALALKLIGRPGYVDDVVQDVFLQAHRGLGKLRDAHAVRPWLRRITVRRSRRWLRKRWVLRWFHEAELDAHAELADPAASPEDRAQVVAVYAALERLPRDERLVWVLRRVEGETLEGIAELLDCSVSTVQRRLRSAEAAMRVVR